MKILKAVSKTYPYLNRKLARYTIPLAIATRGIYFFNFDFHWLRSLPGAERE